MIQIDKSSGLEIIGARPRDGLSHLLPISSNVLDRRPAHQSILWEVYCFAPAMWWPVSAIRDDRAHGLRAIMRVCFVLKLGSEGVRPFEIAGAGGGNER
jgi:hypothetical protein